MYTHAALSFTFCNLLLSWPPQLPAPSPAPPPACPIWASCSPDRPPATILDLAFSFTSHIPQVPKPGHFNSGRVFTSNPESPASRSAPWSDHPSIFCIFATLSAQLLASRFFLQLLLPNSPQLSFLKGTPSHHWATSSIFLLPIVSVFELCSKEPQGVHKGTQQR